MSYLLLQQNCCHFCWKSRDIKITRLFLMLNVQKLLFFIQTVYNLSLVSLQFYTMPQTRKRQTTVVNKKKVNKYSKMFSLKNCDSVPSIYSYNYSVPIRPPCVLLSKTVFTATLGCRFQCIIDKSQGLEKS